MIIKHKIDYIKNTYGINVIDQLIYCDPRRVSFFADLQQTPYHFHVMTGDVTVVGLEPKDCFTSEELLSKIEPNNLLAEVEGKNIFIETIRRKFLNFEKELYLYMPIKSSEGIIWLNIFYRKIEISSKLYVIGEVIRIYDDTPPEIVYYQKTYQDPLTKLFTRETLKMHMNNLTNIDNSYIMYLDIDRFKQINDRLGHQVGDQFLIDIANFFISKWEHNVLYYRLGGDEFFLYCYDHTEQQIIERAKKLIHDIEHLNEVSKSLNISASIGIVKILENNQGYHTLLNLGDEAMYQSKNQGSGNITLVNK
ncbi:MAG: GGDEF domain-containing protein [Acholeplasma sp.]|nr:GGDEF domain-containing protein [Acholeplasma sp.]